MIFCDVIKKSYTTSDMNYFLTSGFNHKTAIPQLTYSLSDLDVIFYLGKLGFKQRFLGDLKRQAREHAGGSEFPQLRRSPAAAAAFAG